VNITRRCTRAVGVYVGPLNAERQFAVRLAHTKQLSALALTSTRP